MVWGIDSQKPHGEHEFPLREECLALVQPIRRSHLPQVHDETTKGTRRTRQKKMLTGRCAEIRAAASSLEDGRWSSLCAARDLLMPVR